MSQLPASQADATEPSIVAPPSAAPPSAAPAAPRADAPAAPRADAPAAASHPAPTPAAAALPFADPTALGLFGLAIACASLLPLAFGVKAALTPEALSTAAWFCLLFGAGCQFLAGLLRFAIKNGLGGTLLTAFSFNWVMNYWALDQLAHGKLPSATVVLSVDGCFLGIFLVMTFAFGYFSRLLFVFLIDIDLLYALRIIKELSQSQALAVPLALATLVLMLLSLYIAFALVLAGASGRALLPLGGPLFGPAAGAVGKSGGRPAH